MEASPGLRKRMQTAEANLPYAPAMQLLSDLGWYKTKWNADEHRENDRWGGWYDQIRLDLQRFLRSRLDDRQAQEFLPTGVRFPAPLEQEQPTETQQKPIRVISHTLSNQWAAEGNNEGSLSLYAGPLTGARSADATESIEQARVTIQRFASCRLSGTHWYLRRRALYSTLQHQYGRSTSYQPQSLSHIRVLGKENRTARLVTSSQWLRSAPTPA